MGPLQELQFFTSPARVPLSSEEARWAQSELSKFDLTVFGANGCNGWELRAGLAQQAEEQPLAE